MWVPSPALDIVCFDRPISALESARRALEREREQLIAERRAFDRFRTRVQRLEGEERRPSPTAQPPQAAGSQALVRRRAASGAPASPASDALARVETAYRETVMAVPHYDDEYGESRREHMSEELGAELAAAVAHGNWTPRLKRSLLESVDHALSVRTRLLDAVDDECEVIDRFDRELTALRSSLESLLDQPLAHLEFNALRLTRERIESLRSQCDDLAEQRQARLQKRRQLIVADVGTFEGYCYRNCELSYPVLAALARCGDRLERALQRVDRHLFVAP